MHFFSGNEKQIQLKKSLIIVGVSFICSLCGVISPIHEVGHVVCSWLSGVPAGIKDWSTSWFDADTWLGSAGGYLFEYIFIMLCASCGVRVLHNPYGCDIGIGWALSIECIVLSHEQDSIEFLGMHALFYLWGLGVLGFCTIARILWQLDETQNN